MTLPPRADPDARAGEVVRRCRALIGAALSATGLVTCCFVEVGIALPEDLLALHRAGEKIVGSDILAADLIFRTGKHDVFHVGDLRYGIGHVGICTGFSTVVHAPPWIGLVLEDTLDAFIDSEHGHFRGVRRLIARA